MRKIRKIASLFTHNIFSLNFKDWKIMIYKVINIQTISSRSPIKLEHENLECHSCEEENESDHVPIL
jgi:hypothetical protein